jgi:hypothetical protein
MPPPPPDRALSERAVRRAVAELAAARTDDIDAVLSALDERQRQRVEALLGEYSGAERDHAAAPEPESERGGEAIRNELDIDDLGSWLAARVNKAPDAAMTATAHAALLTCVAQIAPARASAINPARQSWRERLAGILSRVRR